MPGLNQKGPMGQGPMTGRKMGCCTNYGANQKNQVTETNNDSNENLPQQIIGRGQGLRFGSGRGKGRGLRGSGMGQQRHFR